MNIYIKSLTKPSIDYETIDGQPIIQSTGKTEIRATVSIPKTDSTPQIRLNIEAEVNRQVDSISEAEKLIGGLFLMRLRVGKYE